VRRATAALVQWGGESRVGAGCSGERAQDQADAGQKGGGVKAVGSQGGGVSTLASQEE